MEEKKKKRVYTNITTPAGTAQWPWLNKPNVKFNPDGEYSVNLILEGDDASSLCEQLDKLVEASYNEAVTEAKPQDKKRFTKATPYTPEYDEDGTETGRIIFKFKMKANMTSKDGSTWTQAPKLFDAKGGKITGVTVYGGSTIKVAGQAAPYVMPATKMCGVSLKLQAVQVIKLVAGGGMGGDTLDSFGFGEEDGFVADQLESFEEVATTEEDF